MGIRNGFIGMCHIFYFVIRAAPNAKPRWRLAGNSLTALNNCCCDRDLCVVILLYVYLRVLPGFATLYLEMSSPLSPVQCCLLALPISPFFFFLLWHSDKPLVFAGDVISTWPFKAAATRGRTWLINSGRQKDEAARGGRRACVETQGKADASWRESLSAARPTRRDHRFTSEALFTLIEDI